MKLCTYLLAYSLLALFSHQAVADIRDRVIVKDANIFSDTYQPLRCSHVFLYEGTLAAIDTKEKWLETQRYLDTLVNNYGFNCIRVAVWNWQMRNATNQGYSAINQVAQDRVQRYVDYASDAGIYILLNLHSDYNTPYREDYKIKGSDNLSINVLQNAKTFWSIYGERYKDQTNVLFELGNEPKIDKNDFANIVGLYHYLRDIAPKTHIVVWSFNVTSQTPPESFLQYEGRGKKKIDYRNASIGFHNYENDGLRAWEDAQAWQQAGFPVICTEFASYADYTLENVSDLPHYLSAVKSAERLGIGWTGWIYEASLQPKYGGKGELYPNDFIEQARAFGVPVYGIEIDNTRQKPGKEPKVSLALSDVSFDNGSVQLAVKAKRAKSVYYYSGNTLIGQSTKRPNFEFEWKNAPVGDHKISARAKSKRGVYKRSSPIHIMVSNSSGVVVKEGFEKGLNGWLGQRAKAVLSNDASSGKNSLRYIQPGANQAERESLSNDRGIVFDMRQQLSAYGPGSYKVSLRAKSGQKAQSIDLITQLNKRKRRIGQLLLSADKWVPFQETVMIEWKGDDLTLGLFSLVSSERADFYIDDIEIIKVSEITPMPVEANFP